MAVVVDGFFGHLVAEDPEHPGLVDDDHGHGGKGDTEHDLQGQGAGSAVEDGDAVGRIDARQDDTGVHAEHAEEGQAKDEDGAEDPGADDTTVDAEASAEQAHNGNDQGAPDGRMGRDAFEHVGVVGAQGKEGQNASEEQGPDGAGHGVSTVMQRAFGLDLHPQSAMVAEHEHEEHATGKAVGVQEHEQVAVVDTILVDGYDCHIATKARS